MRLQARLGCSPAQAVNAMPKPFRPRPLSSLALVGADVSLRRIGLPHALDVGVRGVGWDVDELRDVAALDMACDGADEWH